MAKVKRGDRVQIASAPEGARWALGKIGYIVVDHDECWATSCRAFIEGTTTCKEGQLNNPVIRVLMPKPEDSGHWDGYKDVSLSEHCLIILPPEVS